MEPEPPAKCWNTMPISTRKELGSVADIDPRPTASHRSDHPGFESPVVTSYQERPDAPLTLADLSAVAKVVVRAGPETAAATTLGVPFGASRSEPATGEQPGLLILGQRPDEWFVVGLRADVDRLLGTLDRTGHVSVVDHTHARALFRLTGPASAQLLAKICGLDLSEHMTPDGAAVSAPVASVTCDIARNDRASTETAGERSYLLACDRSFAQYLFDAILDAGAEFDIGVAGDGLPASYT
jgi:heterotetrameric sarcosine oxidase gamma subunit